MSYVGTNDVINIFGGTKRITVGSGTNMVTTALIESNILKADALIDGYLNNIYGTSGFGTSASGTRGVPALIKSISEDISAAYTIDSVTLPIENSLVDYGTRLMVRAMSTLEKILAGEIILTGYSAEETAIPQGGDYDFTVYDELVSLSGTELVNLSWRKVVPYSEDVKENVLDGTTVYTRDTDYKMYYFNDRTSGTNFGKIRRLATGSITNNQQVKVTYNVYKEHVFGIVDRQAMGQADSGVGIGQVLP
jgi:hypothetical protein